MRSLIAAACVIAAVAVAGCSSDTPEDANESTTSVAIPPEAESSAGEAFSPQNAALTKVGDGLAIIESLCGDEPPLLELGGMWVNLSVSTPEDSQIQRAERRPPVGTVDPTSGQEVAGHPDVRSFDLAVLSDELEALEAVQPPFTDALLMIKRGTPHATSEVSVSLTDLPTFPLVRPIPNTDGSDPFELPDSIDVGQGVTACS